jgi:pyruvate,orthophosphate dikinase
MQQGDFEGHLRGHGGLRPVTIRFLDPPLHEFLPPRKDIEDLAKEMGLTVEQLNQSSPACTSSTR